MPKSSKKPRGRPPKQANERKEDYLDVRLEPAEKQAFKNAADLAGIPLSTWVRERLRLVARKELEEANQEVPFLKSRI